MGQSLFSLMAKNFVEFWCKKLMRFCTEEIPAQISSKELLQKNELITPMIKSWPVSKTEKSKSDKCA